MHTKWQGYDEDLAAKDFVARKAHTIALSKAQGTHWNAIKSEERLGNCPEAIIVGQATINLDSQLWKSLEDSLPKLHCVDIAEAYVAQESASSRILILCEKKRYDLQFSNGHLHEKPTAKGRYGKENQ
jgi:hypothetical protein